MSEEKNIKQAVKPNEAHFRFETTPQRLKQTILDEYNTIKEKKKKDDFDKMFIETVEAKMKTTKMKLTGIHLPTGVKKTWIVDSKTFDKDSHIKTIIAAVKDHRAATVKVLKGTQRSWGGAKYETFGGVFTKPNLILPLAKQLTTNDPLKPKLPKKPKTNYIGVELEFNANISGQDVTSIAKKLQDAGLAKYVCVGTDGSCGFEVRVLLDETDFIEPLTKITDILKGMGFSTDHRCGTHVHLDMRNRDQKKCYQNLFNSQTLLRKLLTKERKKNTFCRKNIKATWDEHHNKQERYHGINTHSFDKYQTIEIRMHQGTLEASKLVPWIKLLLKVVNFDSTLEKKVHTLKLAQEHLKLEPELYESLKERILNKGA